ncbi:hypothetical protein OOT46_11170 [Aquabacterium sp. A7-Y]|uniref:hypothetical protein n=1 Tax=Aquabacterium sp. A7-Y TaxID=1349605 RepID=UPI00223D2865|nr:hypothetical protein [Aquabacterium sp. A7-Y]MCW7538400.1 hypothetical protein [Aquabacterium sp. A7-Y]
MQLTQPLNEVLGKHISHLCPFSLGQMNGENHCAHFVSHMLGYEFAETCKNLKFTDKKRSERGATIRVNSLFNAASHTGQWDDKPLHLSSCLLYVTLSSNITQAGHRIMMGTQRQKHIGIFIDGRVWHYSNLSDKITVDPLPDFVRKFTHAYRTAGSTVQFFYGDFL